MQHGDAGCDEASQLANVPPAAGLRDPAEQIARGIAPGGLGAAGVRVVGMAAAAVILLL